MTGSNRDKNKDVVSHSQTNNPHLVLHDLIKKRVVAFKKWEETIVGHKKPVFIHFPDYMTLSTNKRYSETSEVTSCCVVIIFDDASNFYSFGHFNHLNYYGKDHHYHDLLKESLPKMIESVSTSNNTSNLKAILVGGNTLLFNQMKTFLQENKINVVASYLDDQDNLLMEESLICKQVVFDFNTKTVTVFSAALPDGKIELQNQHVLLLDYSDQVEFLQNISFKLYADILQKEAEPNYLNSSTASTSTESSSSSPDNSDTSTTTTPISATPAEIRKIPDFQENYVMLLGCLSVDWKETVLSAYSEANTNKASEKSMSDLFDRYARDSKNPRRLFVWETTCHIMHELSGRERNNIFRENNLLELCKAALMKAKAELKTENDLPDNKRYLIGGVAIWNLLLSEEDGGVYPKAKYKEFLQHLHQELSRFIIPYKFEPEDIRLAFKSFKEYALQFKDTDAGLLARVALDQPLYNEYLESPKDSSPSLTTAPSSSTTTSIQPNTSSINSTQEMNNPNLQGNYRRFGLMRHNPTASLILIGTTLAVMSFVIRFIIDELAKYSAAPSSDNNPKPF